MKYNFKFAIGDWSKDGHGKCDYFVVKSNKPVEEVRESHYKIKNVTGINIDELCSEYGDSAIHNDVYMKLIRLGFDFKSEGFDVYLEEEEEEEEEDLEAYCNSLSYLKLWIFLLKQVDKSLEIEIIKNDIPMFQFYGYDKERRHIGASGYGLFN